MICWVPYHQLPHHPLPRMDTRPPKHPYPFKLMHLEHPHPHPHHLPLLLPLLLHDQWQTQLRAKERVGTIRGEFTSSIKHPIRKFLVNSCRAVMAKKCTKKCNERSELLFWFLSLLLFFTFSLSSSSFLKLPAITVIYRVFSHDVTAAMLVFQNKEMAAMLVSQTKHLVIELYFYANTFFCFSKPIWSVVT